MRLLCHSVKKPLKSESTEKTAKNPIPGLTLLNLFNQQPVASGWLRDIELGVAAEHWQTGPDRHCGYEQVVARDGQTPTP